jgi:hypothetical protein
MIKIHCIHSFGLILDCSVSENRLKIYCKKQWFNCKQDISHKTGSGDAIMGKKDPMDING